MNNADLKRMVVSQAEYVLGEKLKSLNTELQLLRESAESDTKSSMGDKYETGREMIMQERSKLEEQKSILQKHRSFLSSIDFSKTYNRAEFGALVITTNAKYLICVPLGIVESEGGSIFFISANSPIGQELLGKKVGDKVVFNNQSFELKSIT